MSSWKSGNSGMEESLLDVSNAIRDRRRASFSSLRCYVVNYAANCAFPYKFFYNGCPGPNGKFMYCKKSTDSIDRCKHNVPSTPMYRFEVQFTDGSSSPLVTATIFDQAHILLGILPEKFARFSAAEQLELVRKATSTGECVDVYINVKEDHRGGFAAFVHLLFCPDRNLDEGLEEVQGTPTKSPAADFQNTGGEECGIGSSSGRRRSTKSSQLSRVKTKLVHLLETLELSD